MKSPFVVALVTLTSLVVVAGCGGLFGGSGSDGGGGVSSLVYTTAFGSSGSVNGASQLVTLSKPDGTTVATVAINASSGPQQQRSFDGLTAGEYRLRAELFSQPDVQGIKTGQMDAVVTVSGVTGFSSITATTAQSIVIAPASATFSVQQSKQFVATGFAGNQATFFAPQSLQWQALGGVASINSDGLALGLAPGTGSIRVTDPASGLIGAATIQVTEFQTKKTKWTVLVFMNAANDLYQFSDLNMNQMEEVASNPEVRFVVQWKQSKSVFSGSTFDGTRRYLVKPDTTNQIASELVQDMSSGVDMGKPQTLADFIQWAKTYYPADRTVLVIWNHGNGWRRGPDDPSSRAVSYDDETGNAIQIWELGQAIGNHTFDMIAWDASLMQMMEVSYEIRSKTPLVIGSEESPPGEGYPYDLVFAQFRDHPDESSKNLSKAFVESMLAVEAYKSRKITQSVIDTSKLDSLAGSLDTLADRLIANLATIGPAIRTIRDNAQAYSQTSLRYFRDMDDLCRLIEAESTFPVDLTGAATTVRAAFQSAIVWEGHNDFSSGSRGIAIDFSPGDKFANSSADYALMNFALSTKWDEWLKVAP